VPDLPYSVVRVAIPPGVTPRLTLGNILEDKLNGLIPRPVARVTSTLAPAADVRGPHVKESDIVRTSVIEPDPEIFSGASPYPRQIVALGEIGSFRDQRYVDVVISPVRFDPRSRGLRVARSVSVTIEFDGDSGERTPAVHDPRLEDLYRDMFVNYAQGSTFRAQPTGFELAATAQPTTGPKMRIRVRANGMVRLDAARLSGTGLEALPLSSYKLSDRGVEVPLWVFDANSNDQLEAGDWVQFYGQALDDEPKTVLNTFIPGGTSIYELRDYTDENVYFLTSEAGPRARLTTRNAPSDLSAPATTFDAVAHAEVDNFFKPLGEVDPWYWGPTIAAGASRTISVPLPGLASATNPAHVVVRLLGRNEDPVFPDHKSKVTLLNSLGSPLIVNNDAGTFDGRALYNHDFIWTYPGTGSTLSSPAQVTIAALSVLGASGYVNQFVPDFIDIGYKRSFQASGDVLTFDYPDGSAEFQVTGLTNVPEVWELTGRVGASGVIAPVRITGGTLSGAAGNFSIRFHMNEDPAIPNGSPRRFIVAGSGAVSIPANPDFTPDTDSDLRATSNQADLIVIASPAALGASSTATLNSLLAWKLANQGITSKVAMIQDVYDEFGNGLATPQAIKNFLAYAYAQWPGNKPAWVLLIGDGSFDSKYNDQTVPPSNFLPTQILFKDDPAFGYYASDSILADIAGGDTIPDLIVGRIPTRTDAQTNVVLQKIYGYEQNPPAGPWRNHAIFVNDRGKEYNDNEAAEFRHTNDIGLGWMKIPPHTQRTLDYWVTYCLEDPDLCDLEAMRLAIKKAVNGTDGFSDGAAIMQYTGHGNFNVWSDDAFFAQGWFDGQITHNDVNDLTNMNNGPKLPFLIVHNCLTGGFEDNLDVTMGEDWLKWSGGGAMAVFAPSGLTDSYWGDDATDQLWKRLFGPTKGRVLGIAVADATNFICSHNGYQACQNYVLLGDPTTRLALKTIAPASGLTAVADGSHHVTLNWSASATPGVRYDVFRADVLPTATYTPIATDLDVTTYADDGATNMVAHFYYVVAHDMPSPGFESAWSNFNSDCAISGPDCVTATPINPNPPAIPTGLVAVDPETGGKLNLTWNANVESDLDHYTLWWMPQGGQASSLNALKKTTFTLTNLQNNVDYAIWLTATNTSGQTSGVSPTVHATPTLVRGVRSPDFIRDLKLGKSGVNAVLTWTPVTKDIYNKNTTISFYEVFRGTGPNFVPGPGNKIGQSATATFTDFGALGAGNPNYDYLVRAVDSSGNVGGLGNQLPNGTDLLTLTKTPNGQPGFSLTLTWPAVTTDFNGVPLPIDHYEIYAADHRFTRADISSGTNGPITLLASPNSPSFNVPTPGPSQYYSVLAVDVRGNKSSF
jgi:hypothetical protein